MLVGVTVRRAVFVSVLCFLCFLLSNIPFVMWNFPFFFSSFPVFLLVLFLFFVLFCFCHVVLSWLSLPFLILSANMKYHFLSFSFLSKICQQHFSPPILSLNFVNKFSSIFSFCHKILSINSPPFFHFVTKFCQ